MPVASEIHILPHLGRQDLGRDKAPSQILLIHMQRQVLPVINSYFTLQADHKMWKLRRQLVARDIANFKCIGFPFQISYF